MYYNTFTEHIPPPWSTFLCWQLSCDWHRGPRNRDLSVQQCRQNPRRRCQNYYCYSETYGWNISSIVMWVVLCKTVLNGLSRSHTKRRMGTHGRARPSFSTTPIIQNKKQIQKVSVTSIHPSFDMTTQDIRYLFMLRRPNLYQALSCYKQNWWKQCRSFRPAGNECLNVISPQYK